MYVLKITRSIATIRKFNRLYLSILFEYFTLEGVKLSLEYFTLMDIDNSNKF